MCVYGFFTEYLLSVLPELTLLNEACLDRVLISTLKKRVKHRQIEVQGLSYSDQSCILFYVQKVRQNFLLFFIQLYGQLLILAFIVAVYRNYYYDKSENNHCSNTGNNNHQHVVHCCGLNRPLWKKHATKATYTYWTVHSITIVFNLVYASYRLLYGAFMYLFVLTVHDFCFMSSA